METLTHGLEDLILDKGEVVGILIGHILPVQPAPRFPVGNVTVGNTRHHVNTSVSSNVSRCINQTRQLVCQPDSSAVTSTATSGDTSAVTCTAASPLLRQLLRQQKRKPDTSACTSAASSGDTSAGTLTGRLVAASADTSAIYVQWYVRWYVSSCGRRSLLGWRKSEEDRSDFAVFRTVETQADRARAVC